MMHQTACSVWVYEVKEDWLGLCPHRAPILVVETDKNKLFKKQIKNYKLRSRL